VRKTLVVFGLCLALLCTGFFMLVPSSVCDGVPETGSASTGFVDPWAQNLNPPGDSIGDGTEENPWKVRSAADLTHATRGLPTTATAANRGRHWILMNNITDMPANWTPRVLSPYSVFDGNNFTIYNLRITGTGDDRGFFSNSMGTIKNITFANPQVTASGSRVAVVAASVWRNPPTGWNNPPYSGAGFGRVARFERVFVGTQGQPGFATTTGGIIGGFVGEIFTNGIAIVEDSVNWANITGGSHHVAGIVSRVAPNISTPNDTEAIITRSGNEGIIRVNSNFGTTSRANGVAGVVGCVCGGTATIEYSYNRGTVDGGHGGLVGTARVSGREMIIRNSFNDAQIIRRTSGTHAIASIAVRETTATVVRAENNWINRDKFQGHFVNGGGTTGTPTNAEHLVNHTNGWFTSTGISAPTPPNTFNINTGYDTDGTANDGLTAFINRLNQGIEHDPAFMVIGNSVQLTAAHRTTRIIYFDTNRATTDPYQIYLDPNPDNKTFSDFPVEGGIGLGNRAWHRFDGWQLDGEGELYNKSNPFPLPDIDVNDRSTIAFTFVAKWTPITIEIEFFDESNIDVTNTSETLHIGENGVWLRSNVTADSFWLIKMAGTGNNDFDILRDDNEPNFNLSRLITEDEYGARFLDAHVDYDDGRYFITINRITEGTDTHTTISYSTNIVAGGTLRVSTSQTPTNAPSWPLMTTPLDRVVQNNQRLWFQVEANPHYEIEEVLFVGTSPTPTGDKRAQRFDSLSSDITEIRINFKKLPYTVNVGHSVATTSTLASTTTPQVFIATGFEQTTINLNAIPRYESGGNVFRFVGWVIWRCPHTCDEECEPTCEHDCSSECYVPLSSDPVFQMNVPITGYWLAEHLKDGTNVSIVAEYAPLYTFSVDNHAQDFNIFPEDATNNSFGVTYQLIHEPTPLGLGLNEAPEGSRLAISVSMSLFASDRHPSFLYEFVRFDGLLCAGCIPTGYKREICVREDCAWHIEEGNRITASVTILGNRAQTIRPVFRLRSFGVTDRTIAQSGGGAEIELGLGISFTKSGGGVAGELQLGNTLTGITAQSVTGYRFENRFTITHQCQDCRASNTPISEIIVNKDTGAITNHPGGVINIDEDFLFCHTSRGRRITITAVYVRLLALDVVSDRTVGYVHVYDGETRIGTHEAESNTLPLPDLERNVLLTIVPVANFGFEFAHFTFTGADPSNPGNRLDLNGEGNLEIIMSGGRSVEAHFRPMRININENLRNRGFGNSLSTRVWVGTDAQNDYRQNEKSNNNETLQLRVNDRIEIISTPDFLGSFGSRFAGFTINGMTLAQINSEFGNVRQVGNMITISMTADWYEQWGSRLDYDARFALTAEFWLIIGSVILVIVLGFVFLAYFLNQQRKKRIIKKYLLADKAARASFNQSNIISGVREGKDVSGVSKAAIKAALKAEKGKDKDKPQVLKKAAAPAPASKPAPPPVQTAVYRKMCKDCKVESALEKTTCPSCGSHKFHPAAAVGPTAASTPQSAPQPAPVTPPPSAPRPFTPPPMPTQQATAPVTPPPVPKPDPAPVTPPPMPKPAPVAPTPPPVAPTPPPPPPPPQPTAPRLSGTKMMPDRSIVDESGKVVATLNTDGSITDATGKVFAKIRMTDGAVISLQDKVLGVVQGDGTIR